MPFTTTWEKTGIYTQWTGHSTSSEMIEFLAGVQANHRFDEVRYSIHDFSACESYQLDEEETEFVAALDRAGATTNSKIRIAVVTTNRDVLEMVSCYQRASLSLYSVKIFDTLAEAREWLA